MTEKTGEKHVVIMFEIARLGENLTTAEQVNEAFGPFDDGEKATDWTTRAEKIIKDRTWLVIPMSDPDVLNKLDPAMN